MLELVLLFVAGTIIGIASSWLYYRDKFQKVLTELEDKKIIISTIYEHADQIERDNVKTFVKEKDTKVAKPKVVKSRKKNEK